MLLRRNLWDVVVIGGGISGLTAAWYCARRGLATALFEGHIACGGQVATVEVLDDWPANGRVSGVDLATALVQSARATGVEIMHDPVHQITVEGDPLVVKSDRHTVQTRRVIIASGAKLRALGVPGEENLRGKGVSQCAHCDGHFFKGQDVIVVGGGDAALQEALVLGEACRSVTIVSRSALRAKRAYVNRATGSTAIRFVWDSEVEAVLGTDTVTGVRLRNLNDKTTLELPAFGVFPFIGVEPNSGFLPATIKRDDTGRIVTDASLRTEVTSVFAIGAVRSGYGGELAHGAGEAAAAAATIARELAK